MLIQFLKFHKYNTKKASVLFWTILLFLFVLPFSTQAQKKYVVVLDAGHGGKDPGGITSRYKEKEVALKTTLLIGKELSKNKEIKVIYTRTTDVFKGLWERGKIANKAKADLFVSIHCNTVRNTRAYGTETFVLGLHANKRNLEVAKKENNAILYEEDYQKRYKYNPNSPETIIGLTLEQEENLDKSLQLATFIENKFKHKLKRKSRGVKQAGFVVLHQTTMPSVLVELGFLTNRKEGRYLNSKRGQKELANSIASAVQKYVNQLKLNTVETFVDEVDDYKTESNIEFKVQIASWKTRLATRAYNFKGLRNVERKKENSFYKYYYGKTSKYKQVQIALKEVKKKGYKTAFVVAFKKGKKISVKEALKNQ